MTISSLVMRPPSALRKAFTLVWFAAYCQAAGAGQISGSVLKPDGTPAAGISVAVMVRPPVPSGTTLFNTVATTAADGTFTVTGVLQGIFALCVNPPAGSLLSPCTWENELTVTLAPNQTLTVPSIQLKSGADLYVRVIDPGGKQAKTEGKVPGASLMLAVRTPGGIMLPMSKTAVDSAGSDYHLTVPFNTDLVFVSFSQAFSLANGVGVPAPQAGLVQTVNIPSGQAQHKEIIMIQ